MSWLARFSNLFRPASLSRDLDDELRHHFEMRVQERSQRWHERGRGGSRHAADFRQLHDS